MIDLFRSLGETLDDSLRGGGDGDCMKTAVLNAVAAVSGSSGATQCEMKLQKQRPIVRSLSCFNHVIQSLSLNLELRSSNLRTFSKLGQVRSAVFVVRVSMESRKLRNSLSHAFAIDGKRLFILDGAERYPLQLSPDSLLLCAGGHPKFSKIVEVLELASQRGHETTNRNKVD
ncbi:hypothetical protein FGB62_165g020 [Gracilaria domingensis]|nr:hypothetical protein FGB62_165g020 [Gracilaria domingensis]